MKTGAMDLIMESEFWLPTVPGERKSNKSKAPQVTRKNIQQARAYAPVDSNEYKNCNANSPKPLPIRVRIENRTRAPIRKLHTPKDVLLLRSSWRLCHRKKNIPVSEIEHTKIYTNGNGKLTSLNNIMMRVKTANWLNILFTHAVVTITLIKGMETAIMMKFLILSQPWGIWTIPSEKNSTRVKDAKQTKKAAPTGRVVKEYQGADPFVGFLLRLMIMTKKNVLKIRVKIDLTLLAMCFFCNAIAAVIFCQVVCHIFLSSCV